MKSTQPTFPETQLPGISVALNPTVTISPDEHSRLHDFAVAAMKQLEMRFKNRAPNGDSGGGPKLWERKLLWEAKTALGLDAGKKPTNAR